jgi:hypothetical protein
MSLDESEKGVRARAGEVYAELLADLLTAENTRKASIEQRGVTVITTAGTLVSLLVALSALLLGSGSRVAFPTGSRWLLIAAIAAFLVAAGFGLAANTPRAYSALSTADLDRIIADFSWSADKEEAVHLIATRRVAELKIAREKNQNKAKYVQKAIICQVIGVGLVAVSIVIVVIS